MTETMKKYTCHKQVLARPMRRDEYNTLRGWEVPADENPLDEGFLVEYINGGQTNHPDYAGYISWSPKDVFAEGYTEDAADPVFTAETVEVRDLNQFVQILGAWHAEKLAIVQHLLAVPEGTTFEIGEEGLTLTGPALAGFKFGIEMVMLELGTLPFAAELEDEPTIN